jgi:tetratricopeptide (TPR) repeat protein
MHMLDIEKMMGRAKAVFRAISLIGLFLLIAGAALTVGVVMNTNSTGDWRAKMVAAAPSATGPIVLAAIGILLACMPFAFAQLVRILARQAQDDRYHRDQLISVLENQNKTLETLREVASLSDAAKQVAYRAKDLEALRKAIQEDLGRGDFEAATMLVNEMERRFGYALEADKLREQINDKSRAAIDQRVADTVEHVELLLTRYEWDDANRECTRLLRLFPTHPEARRLPEKVLVARDGHKRELLKMWKEAVAKDDVDRSLELLRELDQYLSAAEAEAYKELARDVFRKKLQQLGVQFALHVHDKNWLEALKIGRQITDEFPNTRMAAEVRERLPILEDKAGQPLAAG